MSASPAITAMMLVRDRADLLEAAAESVLRQDDGDFELVVLDDGSADDTWHVAQDIARRDDRVVLMRNARSAGIPAARNQVLAAARGRFVAICDSDDLSRPGRFEAQRAAIEADARVVGAGVRIAAFHGDDLANASEPPWHWGLRDGRLPFAFPGGMFRTDALRAVGGFDERYPIAEDLQLAYRLAGRRGTFALVDEVLLDYRLHEGSITQRRAALREWCTLKAQLRGLRELRGGFSPRGYAVIVQTKLRLLLALLGLRR